MAELTKEDVVLKNKIAERIENLRMQTGFTQSEFAKEHNIDRQALSRWESKNNRRGVTIYTIQRFCNMLDISLQDFFDSSLFK
ncbi:hypothetical protein VF13_38715 [Nostoc linckia z16]|nr:hypothetical protein VF13_38715 [Nostoc linckia z16]